MFQLFWSNFLGILIDLTSFQILTIIAVLVVVKSLKFVKIPNDFKGKKLK